MSNEVSILLTACGRPDLLKITLLSFLKFNTYPIKEIVITEDSGNIGINDFIQELLPFPCILLYNKTRIGQMKTIENALPYLKTPYIFHCEEDWEFYDYGFIEKSFEILNKNKNITSVWLRSHIDIISRYQFPILSVDNDEYYIIGPNIGNFSWNPGLRTLEVQITGSPYINSSFDEGSLSNYFREKGMVSAITNNKNGYVRHIGWDRHVY